MLLAQPASLPISLAIGHQEHLSFRDTGHFSLTEEGVAQLFLKVSQTLSYKAQAGIP